MSKQNKYQDLIDNLMSYIGGKDNISYFTHCVTRLRFNFKDKSLVKEDEISKLPGILGTKWMASQLQIIIGADVQDVYDEICKKYDLTKEESVNENLDEKKEEKPTFKSAVTKIIESIVACVVPLI